MKQSEKSEACHLSSLFSLFFFLLSVSFSITPTLGLFQDLMEQLEKQDRTIRKLKKQLKVYSKRIGEMGGEGEIVKPAEA